MSNGNVTLGYIGLGIMGGAMAANLRKAGHDLLVWNRTRSKMDPLVALGAKACDSPADLASRGPAVVFLNVKDTPDVEAVLFGEQGLASAARQGLIVVDNSTISPVATQRFAERLLEQGVTLIDAPVSGGDVGAREGTLSIMVGGPEEAVARVRPLLEILGKQVTHLGPTGMGQACKACNQVAVVCSLLGVCESVLLAKKLGLDPAKMVEVVSAGAGGSWQLANLGPRIVEGDHAPGFMIDLVLKDLALVAEAAREHRLPLPGTALVEQLFRGVAASPEGGELGTQALVRALERLASM